MKRLAAFALALVLIALPAAARPIVAEGVANIADGDLASARSRAIADALEQAVAQGGLRVDARTESINGTLVADRMSTAATGRLLGHRILSETRDRDLYRVAIEADVAAEAPRACPAPPSLHMLAATVEADSAVDPVVGRPLAARITGALVDALGRAGVVVGDAWIEAAGVPDMRRSSERYNALYTVDPLPTAGLMLAATLRLERRIAPRGTPITGVPGERLEATLVLDVIDAGTRRLIARLAARRAYDLTSPLLDLLPEGYQPSQMLKIPSLDGLAADAARQVAALPACGPRSVAVVGGQRGTLTLGAGSADGVAKGSFLRVGDGEPFDDRGGWTVVEVTEATPHRSMARAVDPKAGTRVEMARAAIALP